MYINSEKDLEDYICDHINEFIEFLKSVYGEDENIEFVGRQIIIGDSRLDLLFKIKEKSKEQYVDISKTFIVVELKHRKAEPKDISQLSRYMNLLYDLEFDERIGEAEVFVKGILLTMGLERDMQEIQMYLNKHSSSDIVFATIRTNIKYQIDNYSRKEEYINEMTVDERLRKTKEVKKCGKKAND